MLLLLELPLIPHYHHNSDLSYHQHQPLIQRCRNFKLLETKYFAELNLSKVLYFIWWSISLLNTFWEFQTNYNVLSNTYLMMIIGRNYKELKAQVLISNIVFIPVSSNTNLFQSYLNVHYLHSNLQQIYIILFNIGLIIHTNSKAELLIASKYLFSKNGFRWNSNLLHVRSKNQCVHMCVIKCWYV